MAFSSDAQDDAVDYLALDSPKTPRVLIADVESGESNTTITNKLVALEKQLKVYRVADQAVLGLVVAGNLLINANRIVEQDSRTVYTIGWARLDMTK